MLQIQRRQISQQILCETSIRLLFATLNRICKNEFINIIVATETNQPVESKSIERLIKPDVIVLPFTM